jgi:hypothetical protein
MLISPLQKYEPKTWSGLTTENHLGALFGQEPELISNVIEQIYKVNLGGDDVVSFLNRFPVEYIKDDVPFRWMLQGADEKNYPIQDYWADETFASKPTKPGVGRSSFWIVFQEKVFSATDVLVGEKTEIYKLRVETDPVRIGNRWAFKVKLVTGDDNLFVHTDELAAGKLYSKDYSLVEQTLSKRGGGVSHTSPFMMENTLSMIRKEYEVPGNMIKKGENKPLAFSFVDEKGKLQTTWLKKLDWDFLTQFRRERARLLLYGNSNRMADGSFGNVGESGYEIRAGHGLYDQMAPSNTFYYNDFDIDWLTQVAIGLSVGKLPEDSRRFVLSTGEYGMYQFHRAVEAKASNWTPNFSQDRIKISGNKMTYQGQFLEYRAVNGIVFELMHDPMKDNPVRNKIYHPEGGLASSREYDLLDFGTANGTPNIQRVALEGEEEIFRYIPGLRDPYSPYNNTTSPSMAASSVDGYQVIRAFIGGIRITNPMRTARFKPSILY